MYKILIILSMTLWACNSNSGQKEAAEEHEEQQDTTHNAEHLLPGGNTTRWKADDVTKKNVAGIMELMNVPGSREEAWRIELATQVQSKLDTLVQQCTMKGPDHDALHAWLEKVLHDLRELKADGRSGKSYDELKASVQRFYTTFE